MMLNVCSNCGAICSRDGWFPEVVFLNEEVVICEDCSIDYEELPNGEIVLRKKE